MPIPHDPYKYTRKERFVVGKSKFIKQNLNPTWEAVTLDVDACSGYDNLIFIRVYDYDEDGTHVCFFCLIIFVYLVYIV